MLGRRREERRRQQHDEQAQQEHNLRMALLGKQSAQMDADVARRSALDVLSAGPHAELDAVGAETVRRGGFGSRLREQATLPSKQFALNSDAEVGQVESPAVSTGRFQIAPTHAEQASIDSEQREGRLRELQIEDLEAQSGERSKQQALKKFIDTPQFWSQGPERRQQIWVQAGYSGEAPQTEDEIRKRLRFQHNLEMEKVGAMYPEGRFGRNRELELWSLNADRITDNTRALYTPAIQAAAQQGDWTQVAALQEQLRVATEEALAPLGSMPGAPRQSELETFLRALPARKAAVIRKNLHDPDFLAALRGEDPPVYQKLLESGAVMTPVTTHRK